MRQYETFELTLSGPAPEGSEAVVDLSAVFKIDGQEKEIKGFYAGNGTYKVRYYPQNTGKYSWKVCSALPLEGQLEGTEECTPAKSDRHGMVLADGIHFRYEDGTRYVPVGTTVYALLHQEESLVEETMETLRTAPFNKVRLCVFPKHFDFNHNEPPCFAFEKTGDRFDADRPCYHFWEELERRLVQMQQFGIEADLILFHPYDNWGFSEWSKEECITYLDYVARRLSAFPNVWWSLANEYDLLEHFEEEWWFEFAQFLHDHDPYGHLLSNHHCLRPWDFSDKNTTHCCIQDSCMTNIPELHKKYGKPVIYDECCYEGNIPFPWGNISGFEMVNRFWSGYTLGGYCSHGETFWNEEEILWWAKGGILHGESPARIGFLRSIMEELPQNLDPVQSTWDRETIREAMKDPEKAKRIPAVVKGIAAMSDGQFQNFLSGNREIMGHCGEEVYLQYWGRHCIIKGELNLPEDGEYDIEVIDVWEMTRTKVLTGVNGKVTVKLPGKEGIAVLAKRQ